jgi:hypothetical protein
MKLIPRVRICGVPYLNELVPNLRADMGCSGLSIPTAGRIKLDEGMCPDMLNATEWHEFIEIFNSEHQLGLSHKQIQSLATLTYQVINDNPEMFQE